MILRELKDTYDIDATNKTYIHPATLRAYFKRLCGIGGDAEAKVPLAEIDEKKELIQGSCPFCGQQVSSTHPGIHTCTKCKNRFQV